ncbi:MAG: 2-oxo acid dehydrogenase subunit E2 [Desulfobacterales bacterium]|jgi:pyruvate dehydrogenase E2 component (dihydrolipoamide acetyltransferase)|nr:2-oxo acid dehydrogenase subunit E2 [Desulfobacterales bacterium]
MAKAFKLPDLGEGIHEGEVLAVRVGVGQAVNEGDIILEVETDKAAVEIPSPYTGTVLEIRVKPGETVRVGQVLMTFSEPGEQPEPAIEPATAVAREAAVPDSAVAPPAPGLRQGPVPASPATRRLARELGVDLAQVPPSGSAGLVTADDVRAFAAAGKPVEAPAAAPAVPAAERPPRPPVPPADLPDFSKWGAVERVPFRSIRRATARQMSRAWAQIPHVNSQDTVDVTRLEAFRRKHKQDVEALGGRLTVTVFALKAVATALKAHPRINASLDAAADEIVLKKHYHIGVAVNTEEGLVVPVVRDVDNKSIKELAVELHTLVQRAHARKIGLEEFQGGTFTITNAGALGGWTFAPIINYPQVAILGLGQGRLQPAVVKRESGLAIAARLIMPAVLCIDHRVLDGADAVNFLKLFKQIMEDPDELLMSLI